MSTLPARIGVYRVESRLGSGGMGEVFLAWDERLERRVAVKRIRQDFGLPPAERERFRREARLAARLSHPAIVQIHDLVTDGADDAIVMEYVEGQTLAERLAAGRLETEEALSLAREIAAGLAAAHEAGLIHRDLKAANVIVTPAGHAKILDFGLARPLTKSDETPLTRRGMVVGTVQSMSPEQARGQEVDERSDLFSLGILLYEMLSGQLPFQGDSPVEILHHLIYEPPPSLRSLQPALSAAAEGLLDRLLAKDREQRPGSAQEVIALLDQLGSGPLARRPRRFRAAAAAAVLIATIAIGATVFLLERPSRRPLRIAVAPIEVVPANDERLALAGSGVLTAALSELTALEGLAPIDPLEAGRGGRSPVPMARATAAGEVLTSEIRREGALAQVTLRRLQGADGRVLWTRTFPVPADAGNLRVLADAVAGKVRGAYPGHDLRPGVPELDVRDQDYAAFLEIKQRVDSGTVPPETQLGKLEEIVRSSPRFLEAQIQAARLAHLRFLSRGDVADLDRATELTRGAKKLSPGDPRPLRQELQIALAANRIEDAEKILAQLERLLSGDPELLVLRARLAGQQGHLDAAVKLQSAAVEQAPSWQNLYWLADYQARRGHIAEARKWFGEILRQAPGNLLTKEALGYFELSYGDLARAERIYEECLTAMPRRALNNLALARFFRGRFNEAADFYRRSLAIEPDYVITQVELASTEVELGHTRVAEALYRSALADLEKNETAVRLSPADAMVKALCLARLGRPREAVELAQAQLRRSPENPYLLQQSALVHSVAGDRASALNNALAALDKGLHPRWLTGSAFRWLRESPEIRSRLARAPN